MSKTFQLAYAFSNQNVKQIISDIVGGCQSQTATLFDFSVVKVYFASAKQQLFQESGIEGLLTILIDRKEWNCFYLRIYHPSNLQILFSMELCYKINKLWQQDPNYPNFCILPYLDGFIGFLFPNQNEAEKISKIIKAKGPKEEDLAKIIEEEQMRQKEAKGKEKKMNFVKNIFLKSKKEEEPDQFECCNLIYSINNGEIKIKDLHQDLIALFKDSQITRKDLCDLYISKEIFKVIASFKEIVMKSLGFSPQRKSIKPSKGTPSPIPTKEEIVFNFSASLRNPHTIENQISIIKFPYRNPTKFFDSIVERETEQGNPKIYAFIEQTTKQIFEKKLQKQVKKEIVKQEIEKFTGLQVQNKCEFILDLSNLQKHDFVSLSNLMKTEIKKIKMQQLEKQRQSKYQKQLNEVY